MTGYLIEERKDKWETCWSERPANAGGGADPVPLTPLLILLCWNRWHTAELHFWHSLALFLMVNHYIQKCAEDLQEKKEKENLQICGRTDHRAHQRKDGIFWVTTKMSAWSTINSNIISQLNIQFPNINYRFCHCIFWLEVFQDDFSSVSSWLWTSATVLWGLSGGAGVTVVPSSVSLCTRTKQSLY